MPGTAASPLTDESTARELMMRFAARTGLTGTAPSRRYLWTDAFAVCNFLGLGRPDLATRLVADVHRVLGRHRPDAPRRGWISGLAEHAGAAHPTAGGLRIGKPLRERPADEPANDRLEWERDGQYFHYLTRWMHALQCVARATEAPQLGAWARELASTAHRSFVHAPAGRPRMVWKMSIDLTRPLVTSMGQHDPLDGYVTCLELASSASPAEAGPLALAAADYRRMIDVHRLESTDPLGLGGMLVDARRLTDLDRDPSLRAALLDAAALGLEAYVMLGELRRGADRRLAFRELGLAIGLAAVADLATPALARHARLRADLLAFWGAAAHRGELYRAHEDINDVMLATALAPDGYLDAPRR